MTIFCTARARRIWSRVLVCIQLSLVALMGQAIPVAVLDFDGVGISQPEATALSNRLRNELFKLGTFNVVDRGMMETIMAEQDFQTTGCTSNDCLVEVGRLIGAQQMIGGSVSKVGGTYSVSCRLVDVETGKLLGVSDYDLSGKLDDMLTKGMRIVALMLSGQNEEAQALITRQQPALPQAVPQYTPTVPVKPYAPKRSGSTVVGDQGLTSYGAKVGLNLANIGGDYVKDWDPAPSMRLGAAVGGFATLDFDLPVTLQIEGLYSMKGAVQKEGSNKSTTAVHYIDINILAKYEAVENIHVFAGPSLGLMPGGKVEWESGDESGTIDFESEDFNGMDFGLIIGGSYGLTLPFGDIVLDARYSLGLKDAYFDTYADEAMKIKNNVIQIMVGYSL